METPSPLIVTQILTPRKRPDLLHRPRLVDFIHEHIDRKLLLISASAGYGKTSLLMDYAHDTELPVCWLSVVEAARDPRVFFDHLIASIQLHFPQFGQRSRRMLQGVEGLADPTLFVGTLVNEIYETIPDYFVVAVDDFHLVDRSRAINEALDTLVQHLPENCHLLLSSRTVPTLTPRGLALLTAHQEIAGLGVKDLRFTAEEIQQLLRQNFGQELSDAAAQELAARSEGWITGILLTTHTMWKGIFEGIIRIQGSDSKVYDYLVSEVFEQQLPEVQRFLLSTSVLQEMNPLLVDEFLGTTSARETLKWLEDQNLFVTRLERGDERWYRYHQLFREFLLTKLGEEHSEEVRPLKLRAAHLLSTMGDVETAIDYYLEVQDFASAMDAVLQVAARTYDAGKLETMARWLDILPPERVQDKPWLLWYRAKIHLESGQLDRATELFEEAEKVFAREEERIGQAQSLVEGSAALRFRGAFRAAIDACERALALISRESHRPDALRVEAAAYRQMGTCHASLGNLAQGEEHLRKALHAYDRLGYPPDIAYVHLDLGANLQLSGNLAGSEMHFQQALDIWEELGNVGLAALTLNNIAIGHYYRAEYAEALQLYAIGLEYARKGGLERPLAFLLAGVGDVRRDQGAYEEALPAYQEALALARQIRERFVVCYVLDAIGNTYRLQGDYSQAIDHVRQAFDRAQERDATFELAQYQTSLGVIQYQQGNVGQAEQSLLSARAVFESSRAHRELARANLHLAQAYYLAGRFQEALECVHGVLSALLELGYDGFLLPVARETQRVLDFAVKRGLQGTLIEHLLHSLCERPSPAVTAVATTATKVQPLLRVYAFGEGRVLRGDQPVSSADWGMAKSKELLFYLLCHRQRRKDQIGTDLWPELSPAKLRSSFHVALYRLRRALDRQECVRYGQDHYYFDRRTNYWYDVEEFEKAITAGAQAWVDDRNEAAKAYNAAVVLYQGDFLEDLVDRSWSLVRRESLLDSYLVALERLAVYHADGGESARAIQLFERVLDKDPYRESAYRGLIRCQASTGQRSAALRTYHRLAECLEADLQASPTRETTELYGQILRDESPLGH